MFIELQDELINADAVVRFIRTMQGQDFTITLEFTGGNPDVYVYNDEVSRDQRWFELRRQLGQ